MIQREEARAPSVSSVSSVNSIKPLEWDSGADIGYQENIPEELSTVERLALSRGSLYENSPTNGKKSNYCDFGEPIAKSSPYFNIPRAAEELKYRLVDYSLSDSSSEKLNFERTLITCSQSLDHLDKKTTMPRTRSVDALHTMLLSSVVSDVNYGCSKFIQTSPVCSDKCIQVDVPSNMEIPDAVTPFRQLANNTGTYTVSKNYRNLNNSKLSDPGSFEYVPGTKFENLKLYDHAVSNESSSDFNTLSSKVTDGVDLITRYIDNLNLSKKDKLMKKVAESLMNKVVNRDPQKTKSRNFNCEVSNRTGTFIEHIDFDKLKSLVGSGSDTSYQNLSYSTGTVSRLSNSTDVQSHYTSTVGEFSTTKKGERIQHKKTNVTSCSDIASSASEIQHHHEVLQEKTVEISELNAKKLKNFLAKEKENQLIWIKNGIDHLNNLKRLCEDQLTLRTDLKHGKYEEKDNLKKCSRKSARSIRKNGARNDVKSVKQRKDFTNCCRYANHEVRHAECTNSSNKQRKSMECHSKSKLSPMTSLSGFAPRRPRNPEMVSSSERRKDSGCGNESDKENSEQSSSSHCRIMSLSTKPYSGSLLDSNSNGSSRYGARINTDKSAALTGKQNDKCSRGCVHVKRDGLCKRRVTQKPPIGYTVLFDKNSSFFHRGRFTINEQICSRTSRNVTVSDNFYESVPTTRTTRDKYHTKSACTLQEYLIKNKPEYVNRAEYRRRYLTEIAQLRELRDRDRKELMTIMNFNSDEGVNDEVTRSVPSQPEKIKRIFSQKAMRIQTERKYQKLPEVQNRKLEEKRKEMYQTNRIMAKVFTKKLQRKVLQGQVNLSNNINVLTS